MNGNISSAKAGASLLEGLPRKGFDLVGDGSAGEEGFLTVRGLSSRLGAFRLDEVSFRIPLGSTLGVIGPSGSGKTLLLKTLAGLEPKASGSVFLGLEDLDGKLAKDRRIGFVFQEGALYPRRTGAGNIAFPAELARVAKAEIDEGVEALGKRLGIAEEYLRRCVEALPAGMRQLVAIARAENRKARLFLMDEPLAHLDPALRRSMRAVLQALRRETGITTLYAFNEPEDALALSEWLLVLEAGRPVQFARAEEVYREPGSVMAMELLSPEGLNALPVAVRGGLSDPWGLEAPVADGEWLLCFRPSEVVVGGEEPVRVAAARLSPWEGGALMAEATRRDGAAFRVRVPGGTGPDFSFRPLEPRFFPRAETQPSP